MAIPSLKSLEEKDQKEVETFVPRVMKEHDIDENAAIAKILKVGVGRMRALRAYDKSDAKAKWVKANAKAKPAKAAKAAKPAKTARKPRKPSKKAEAPASGVSAEA